MFYFYPNPQPNIVFFNSKLYIETLLFLGVVFNVYLFLKGSKHHRIVRGTII